MIGQRLEVRQGQGLVITPQLQQAIKLLQLSNLELEAFIEGELERNPLLQRDEGETGGEASNEPVEAAASSEASELQFTEPSGEAEQAMDARTEDLYDDAPGERDADRKRDAGEAGEQPGLSDWSRAGSGGGMDNEGMERPDTRDLTLWEHLQAQASAAGFTPADHAIALTLIDATDEGGYLRGELQEIADRLGVDLERIEAVLTVCHGFEPTGVMARSAPECLKLQLIERNRFDPAMEALLDNLELLARRDLAALRKVCGVDAEDLAEMIAELKGLTPRPGAGFGGEPAQTVVPDVHVRPDPAGGWRVELNSDTLPRLLMDKRYHGVVSAGARSETEKAFVADCAAQASWLVKSLDQRAKTILKVGSEIVRQQDAFLAFGVEFLRPLNLKTVADAIGMHESTVSRVTSNKYVSTPRGVFELKFFFTAAIQSSDGGALHSAEAVRHRIKTMIDGEAADGDVLSDDRIVEILNETGIDIARRTVAKYREALRIPSSVQRRRLMKAG
ncbi:MULTISPECIES: RNA polymerase factor sigma-54 [unclassified Brevundimonas]|uniref:RNA polymerase factor sigma-54 n=1 Tax=unclassified Brevundimonas TaxID=2622653 RepID=UPI000CFD69C1|nr:MULTISPECIES: RNA polymerase factor sigma-54 [unclassified Brevundimonas]PRA31676.1 RNA polymerase sigma-54 factor [Brevundimonas sp. MYb27]PQZ83549.1 RNA polymerase sigma-54 factor [Brevundimonas sp. MYb31]PRB15862.1 RNA polymerase sigma-54 factor [Brevundimonas sp. MYb52]PRB36358.1 RNA polymerase sigma-54 factor [Brevundimonas sp. MYb46]PRB45551.1 RNA polymerase sigma-54 factor [Brevundimonas sp. MYb33]